MKFGQSQGVKRFVTIASLCCSSPRSVAASIVKRADKANHDSVRHVVDANLGVFEMINTSKRWCIVYKHFDTRNYKVATANDHRLASSEIVRLFWRIYNLIRIRSMTFHANKRRKETARVIIDYILYILLWWVGSCLSNKHTNVHLCQVHINKVTENFIDI